MDTGTPWPSSFTPPAPTSSRGITRSRDQLNPSVVTVLTERGLDPTKEFSKPLTNETAREADVIVTMGYGDTCPVYPGKRFLDWELEDPAGKPVEEVRPIVDEIDRRVQGLLEELRAPATTTGDRGEGLWRRD